MDFVIPADDRVKIKEIKKIDKHLDLDREQRKRKNMRVTVIPIVIVPKKFEKRLEEVVIGERIKTIQITALLRKA